MRSLAVKLTLAFLLVGLTGAVLVAILVRQATQRQFDRLIVDQNQQALAAILTRYYAANDSWAGLETVFRTGQEPGPAIHGPGSRWEARRDLFAIADADGEIVFGGGRDNLGRQLPRATLENGLPLEVGGETVGWLLFAPDFDRWRPGTPEGDFLLNIRRATFLSATVATGIALLLGGLLAYGLTRSLRELTGATRALARGQLGRQVQVRSQDELGELAASFNQMSAGLARATELRRQMTADIAHDLRTPLSVILGYSEALSEGKLEPTPEMFAVMHTEAQHLSRLIEDLKTLSLAEAGELPLNRQRVSPGVLLQRAAGAQRVEAERAGVDLRVDLPPDLPEIEVDVERMAQVLGNLVSNALRFTPSGGEIALSAGQTGGEVWLRVADTGAGIAPEDLPYIFERSFRGDKARRQGSGETGLGLSIAKSLVEAQGGAISVESAPGAGATFTMRFPAAP